MKNLKTFLFVSVIGLTSIAAQAEYVDGLIPQACKVISKKGETVICAAQNYKAVNAAKADTKNLTPAQYKALSQKGFNPTYTDARDLGLIVDADTSSIYNYDKFLRDADGVIVGVMNISAYTNSETEERIQVTLRLNLTGKITKVSVKPF